ncbi:DUF2975 domain-containing protein [Bacillaceae bacterium Marseille-Q3522]|nr:DUF2975 domain-containing protein [Bacillaceae bacterium Marseille-Q3522]
MNWRKVTFLKVIVIVIGIIVFSLCIFALPSLAEYSAEMNPEYAYLKYPVLIGLYVTTLPFFFSLYQALKLLSLIENKNAFSESAVMTLNQIKYCAIAIVILYVIGMILLGIVNALHPGIALIELVIIFTAFVISLFTDVLQELLKNALKLKTENDLTI